MTPPSILLVIHTNAIFLKSFPLAQVFGSTRVFTSKSVVHVPFLQRPIVSSRDHLGYK